MDWMLRRFSSSLIIMIMFWVSAQYVTGGTANTCGDAAKNCAAANNKCWMIFIDGGFNGQIRIPNTTNGTNRSMYFFSFNTSVTNLTKTTLNKDCGFEQLGVWLFNKSSIYQILIDNKIKPQTPICFGSSNHTCSNDTLENCISNWPNRSSCENLTCFDLDDTCKNPSITNISKNTTIITLNGTSVQCQKGGDFRKIQKHLTLKEVNTTEMFFNGQSSYSEVLKNLTTKVLNQMENISLASLSLGNISGIFVKANTSAPEPVFLMYTAKTDFNINNSGNDEFQRMFYIPNEAFEKAQSQRNSTLCVGLLRIPIAADDEQNSTLDNEMFSIDMGADISGLSDPVNLTFNGVNMTRLVPECHSWDGNGSKPNWTTDGCKMTRVDSKITCSCTHLTFFALLMTEPKLNETSDSDVTNLTYITSIGCGLSIFFLGLALIIHFLLRRGRTGTSEKILINLFLALFLLNFTFLINEYVAKAKNQIGCMLMAGFMHYSMLSSFQWFFLVASNLCLQFVKNVADIKHYFTMFCICGWVPPAIVVIAIFATGKYSSINPGPNITMCWITDTTVHYTVNIGYYAIVFIFTFLIFVGMLRFLCLLQIKQPNVKSVFKQKTKTSGAITFMGLFFLLGLSWGFAFFAYGVMRVPALYIFTTLNSFQGFFLFIYYYRSRSMQDEKLTPSNKISSNTRTSGENPYNLPNLS